MFFGTTADKDENNTEIIFYTNNKILRLHVPQQITSTKNLICGLMIQGSSNKVAAPSTNLKSGM